MDLFLETPQQKADRILRQQQRLFELGTQSPLDNAASSGSHLAEADGAGECASSALFESEGRPKEGAEDASRARGYSLEQESYRKELDYNRARHRSRRRAARLRALATAVLVPLCLVLIFLASYALTCILNGASPDEVVQHLMALGQRLGELVVQIRSSWGI